MKKYTIEELIYNNIEIIVTSQEQANKISKAHGYKSFWNVGNNCKKFYIKCIKNSDCPSWTSDSSYFKKNYKIKDTITFDQIDFQEKPVNLIESLIL